MPGWLTKPRRQSKPRRQKMGSRVMSEVTAASGTVHWIGVAVHRQRSRRDLRRRRPRTPVAPHRGACRAQPGGAGPTPGGPSPAPTHGGAAAQLAPWRRRRLHAARARTRPAARRLRRARRPLRGSSYVSDAVLDQVPAAEAAGVVVLTECGLDPGHRPPLRTDSPIARARPRSAPTRPPRTASPRTAAASPPCPPTTSSTASAGHPPGVLRSPFARPIRRGRHRDHRRPPLQATRTSLIGEAFEAYPHLRQCALRRAVRASRHLDAGDLRARHPAPRRLAAAGLGDPRSSRS